MRASVERKSAGNQAPRDPLGGHLHRGHQAGASLRDIVSVRQWLSSAEDVRAYVEVRNRFITHTPVFMLGVIPGLVRSDFLIEIEVVAAVLAGKRT